MATKSGGSDFPPIIGNTDSPDAARRQFIDAPLAAAREPAMSAAVDVLKFMSAIPDALIASQERELNRMRAQNAKGVNAVAASITRAEQMRAIVTTGLARVHRMLALVGDKRAAFHGFVSDATLKPLHGLTVRVTAPQVRTTGHRGLSAKTEDDGYFRIGLENTQPATGGTSLSGADATSGGADTPATVDIVDGKGNVLYRDPEPLAIGSGTIYREYVIDPHAHEPA
jgi:hypothetical protein